MKSRFSARWWIAFVLLNLIPTNRALALSAGQTSGSWQAGSDTTKLDNDTEIQRQKNAQQAATVVSQGDPTASSTPATPTAPVTQATPPVQSTPLVTNPDLPAKVATPTVPMAQATPTVVVAKALDMKTIQGSNDSTALISGFAIDSNLSDSKQINLLGQAPAGCLKYLSIQSHVDYNVDQLRVKVLDQNGSFTACVQVCHNKPFGSACEPKSISSLAHLSANPDRALNIVLETGPDSAEDFNIDGKPAMVGSQRDYDLALLAYQVTACRHGKYADNLDPKEKLRLDMAAIQVAANSLKKLKQMGRFRKGKDDANDLMDVYNSYVHEIRTARTDAELAYVRAMASKLNILDQHVLSQSASMKIINDARADLQTFSAKYQDKTAPIVNEIAAITKKLGMEDLQANSGNYAAFQQAMVRVQGDLNSSGALIDQAQNKGLFDVVEGQVALGELTISMHMRNLVQLASTGSAGMSAFAGALEKSSLALLGLANSGQCLGTGSSGSTAAQSLCLEVKQAAKFAEAKAGDFGKSLTHEKQLADYQAKVQYVNEQNARMQEVAQDQAELHQQVASLNSSNAMIAQQGKQQVALSRSPTFNNPALGGSGPFTNPALLSYNSGINNPVIGANGINYGLQSGYNGNLGVGFGYPAGMNNLSGGMIPGPLNTAPRSPIPLPAPPSALPQTQPWQDPGTPSIQNQGIFPQPNTPNSTLDSLANMV